MDSLDAQGALGPGHIDLNNCRTLPRAVPRSLGTAYTPDPTAAAGPYSRHFRPIRKALRAARGWEKDPKVRVSGYREAASGASGASPVLQ